MIKVFTQEDCSQCKLLKNVLKAKGIEYDECTDVAEMTKRGISHTPTVEIDGALYNLQAVLGKINAGELK